MYMYGVNTEYVYNKKCLLCASPLCRIFFNPSILSRRF